MIRRSMIVAALLFAAALAQAQQMPPGKWWRRPDVIQQLGITSEQQDKLDEIFRSTANDLIDAKADVEKLQVALRGEIDRSQLRRQEIQRIATQLNAARGRLFDRELMMLVDMRGVLTAEQWNKMRMHLDRMQERRQEQRKPQPMPNRRRP